VKVPRMTTLEFLWITPAAFRYLRLPDESATSAMVRLFPPYFRYALII
jgi:hypothetical protein